LAAELEKEFGVKATMIKGGGGIFDVIADGAVVFSKKGVGDIPAVGRFPEPGEVVEKLKAMSG
jgi:predicted Rdx family selenoprotein